MGKPRILVVGSLVMDLIVRAERFPDSGESVVGESFQTAPGGKGANQAVQAARLGAQATMVGKVGRDDFGGQLLASLREAGVDTAHVTQTDAASTAVANVQIETGAGKSANRIVVVLGANGTMSEADVAFLRTEIADYDLVMLQLEIPMEVNRLVASYAAAHGVPVMLNCAPYAPMPPELLQSVRYLSPNEHEARLLTGQRVETEAEIAAALRRIREMGVRNPLITLGERGAAYLDAAGKMTLSPALSGVRTADTTAAGDSFVAAFSTAVCAGAKDAQALRFANCAAALTVSRMGAQPSLPALSEVLALMRARGEETAPFLALQ